MDKRWKQLTAPLWEMLIEGRKERARLISHDQQDWLPSTRASYLAASDEHVLNPIVLKLLEIRRARLAGECPVYWALANK